VLPREIGVNAIGLGSIEPGLWRDTLTPELRHAVAARARWPVWPARHAAQFRASDVASYVTGQTL
jgi:NAD(P)-dependent dehydrogenase (short-subunit alcohol dehydrogenase family)